MCRPRVRYGQPHNKGRQPYNTETEEKTLGKRLGAAYYTAESPSCKTAVRPSNSKLGGFSYGMETLYL